MICKTKSIKWVARIIGGFSILLCVAFLIGEGVPDLLKRSEGPFQSILILMGFAFLGYIFAWYREKEGGFILIFSSTVLGLNLFYSLGMTEIFTVIIYSIPLMIAGILFFLVAKKDG